MSVNIMKSSAFILLLVFSLFTSTTAIAHQVRLSVYVEGHILEGELYFVGGGNPPGKGARVELLQDSNIVQSVITDDEGYFTFAPVEPADYVVRADPGQGHAAVYQVASSEFPDANPVEDEATEARTTTLVESKSARIGQVQCVATDSVVLQSAVAKAIRPLREQLDRYETKVRWHDVIGGIGYIFGLFGLLALLRGRKA